MNHQMKPGRAISRMMVFLALLLSSKHASSYTGILVGWDVSGVTNRDYGTSPFAPTTTTTNLSIIGLTRGSGVSASSGAIDPGWGGYSFSAKSEADAIASNEFFTFSVTASNNYTVSFSSVSEFDYVRQGSGPPNGVLQYQIGTGTFTDIINLSYLYKGIHNGQFLGPIDLSGISSLQNVAAGITVTFRIVNYGGADGTGDWYVYDTVGGPAPDLAIQGTVTNAVGTPPSITTQPANAGLTNLTLQTATFGVAVSGTTPLSYQWVKDGIKLTNGFTPSGSYVSGAATNSSSTTNTLQIIYTHVSDLGGYSVVVSNIGGSVTSSVATLTVMPPFAGNDFYGRARNISLKIKKTDLLTNDTAPDNIPVTLAGISLTTTNGVTLMTNGTYIFYTNNLNVPDRFNYTVSDGYGGSATGAVFINIVQVTGSNSLVSMQTAVPGAGTNTLEFAGLPYSQYAVQFATNLTTSPWLSISTNTTASNGLWTVIDPAATNAQRFYRVITP